MAREQAQYHERIVQDPGIMVGKPVVKGTRIPVEVVLAYLARNPNFDDLFADYPRLTMDDVKACFAYARAIVEKRRRRAATTSPSAGHQASS
jgi:uncharacterized protein (DUF433 family)